MSIKIDFATGFLPFGFICSINHAIIYNLNVFPSGFSAHRVFVSFIVHPGAKKNVLNLANVYEQISSYV